MFVSSSRFISFLYSNISRREAYVRPLHTCTSQDLSLHPRSLVRNKRTRDSNTLTISVANSNISLIASSMYIPLPFLFPSSPFPFPFPSPLPSPPLTLNIREKTPSPMVRKACATYAWWRPLSARSKTGAHRRSSNHIRVRNASPLRRCRRLAQ